MELKELHCKHCGAPIQEHAIDRDRSLARCEYCGTIFSLELSRPAPMQVESTSLRSMERQPVPLPGGIEALESETLLQISYKWFTPKFFFLLFFCIFWDGFMIAWHGISLFSGAWFMSLFGLLHTGVGIGLTYYTIAGFVNRTTIHVTEDWIQIWHHPLPWWGDRRVAAHEVGQIYCTEKISRSDNGTSYSYEVHAIFPQGKKVTLVQGLNEPEQALYIEQALERYLSVQDRPIRGELPR